MENAFFKIIAVLSIFYVVLTELLDWTGRIRLLKDLFPGFLRFLANRGFRAVLLFVAIGLLVRIELSPNAPVVKVEPTPPPPTDNDGGKVKKDDAPPKHPHVGSQEKQLTKPQKAKPDIVSVSPISPQAWQNIVITGTHLGTNPPFRDCTDFLVIRDLTANRAFPSTGPWGGCNNPILVTSWTDNEIKIEGLPAYAHGQPAFNVGDTLKIEVRNPQESWNSPAYISVTVSEDPGPNDPRPNNAQQSNPISPSPNVERGTHIVSVTPITTKAWQRIVITGVHFGTNPPLRGCPDFIRITDLTTSRFFPSLGSWGDCANPILITSWTDTEIVIEGFPAYQQGQDAFMVGDALKVELRSPQENWAPLKWYSLRVVS